jgi:hypothetical protein
MPCADGGGGQLTCSATGCGGVMGFRFFRRVRLLPGVTLNFSKSGVSTSLGPRGAHYTIGPRGTRTTVGLPGTGLYWTQSAPRQAPLTGVPQQSSNTGNSALGCLIVGFIAIAVLGAISGIKSSGTTAGSPGSGSTATSASFTTAWVTPARANCRSAADKASSVVGQLARGSELHVFEQANGWSRVQTANGECWVSSSLLANSSPDLSKASEESAPSMGTPKRAYALTAPSVGSGRRQRDPPAAQAHIYYRNCAAARAAGAAPLYAGQPGYSAHLDRDRDGIACE